MIRFIRKFGRIIPIQVKDATPAITKLLKSEVAKEAAFKTNLPVFKLGQRTHAVMTSKKFYEGSDFGTSSFSIFKRKKNIGTYIVEHGRGSSYVSTASIIEKQRNKGIGSSVLKKLRDVFGDISSDKYGSTDQAIGAWKKAGAKHFIDGRIARYKLQSGKPTIFWADGSGS